MVDDMNTEILQCFEIGFKILSGNAAKTRSTVTMLPSPLSLKHQEVERPNAEGLVES